VSEGPGELLRKAFQLGSIVAGLNSGPHLCNQLVKQRLVGIRAGAQRLCEGKELADFILDESVRVAELGFHPTQEISFKLKRGTSSSKQRVKSAA